MREAATPLSLTTIGKRRKGFATHTAYIVPLSHQLLACLSRQPNKILIVLPVLLSDNLQTTIFLSHCWRHGDLHAAWSRGNGMHFIYMLCQPRELLKLPFITWQHKNCGRFVTDGLYFRMTGGARWQCNINHRTHIPCAHGWRATLRTQGRRQNSWCRCGYKSHGVNPKLLFLFPSQHQMCTAWLFDINTARNRFEVIVLPQSVQKRTIEATRGRLLHTQWQSWGRAPLWFFCFK